ncbi:MAG: hypothetical protein RMJ17_02080, partial [Candidatus Aenigmarchaeota archaeon]|nr:hypothetical protein [Candidatus Aenigmarchaeota archaeon]MDW8149361.1 hypothetical protein [Candidatus Aenigmarchaeota archaeon]
MKHNEYFLKEAEGKQAIFRLADNQRVSDWFDYIYCEHLLNGKSEFYIASVVIKGKTQFDTKRKYAIFHISGKQISNWCNDISFKSGLITGSSNYFIAEEGFFKAIFDSTGKRISDWHSIISTEGLVSGQSDYYIADVKNSFAIFHVSGKQISKPYSYIVPHGFVKGQSDYYIAKLRKNHYAIFHYSGERITKYFKYIYSEGLVEGESE